MRCSVPSRRLLPEGERAMEMEPSVNVLGGPLELCSGAPRTGFFRDGHCNTC